MAQWFCKWLVKKSLRFPNLQSRGNILKFSGIELIGYLFVDRDVLDDQGSIMMNLEYLNY